MINTILKFTLLLLAWAIFTYSKSIDNNDNCHWCIYKSNKVANDIMSLSLKSPEEQLKSIRASGLCVMIMESGRKTPRDFFTWGKIETPKEPIIKISKHKNLMGKTLCKGEHELSTKCVTIALASDAPKSTLIHEYLHTMQIQNDPNWCRVSKQLWKREPTTEEAKMMRDKEWDVHQFLWENRENLNLNIEDELSIASETIEEAELRKSFDPTASAYVKDQKLTSTLNHLIEKYKKAIITK